MLALALLLAAQPAQDTLRYNFESVNSQDIDATAAGGGMMQNEMALSGRMHVVLSDTTGGMLAHVVIDTATLTSSNPQMAMLPMEITSGTAFHLYVVDGEIKSGLTPPAMNLGVIQVMAMAGNLFPKVRRDLAVGQHWTDTTTTDSLTPAGRVTNQSITLWSVTDRQDQTATYHGDVTGTLSAAMEQGTMTGATTGTQEVTIAPGQPVRRSESATHVNMQVMTGQMAIEVSQETKIVISREP